MRILLYSFAAFVVITISYACSKASLVGSDLFVPDSIEVFFKDDYEVNAASIRQDSFLTYNEGTPVLSSFIIGQLDDPVFGETNAEAYVGIRFGGNNVPPNFEYEKDGIDFPVTIDSVVLTMSYNESGFYGDSTAVHNLEVRVVDEEIDGSDEIYSNMSFPSSTVIGNTSLVPSPGDSISIINPGDDTTTVVNQLRMRLDNSWAEAMVSDPELVDSSSSFLEYTPALHIVDQTSASSTMGINFGVVEGVVPDNSIIVYYTDTLPRQYRFTLTDVRNNFFEHFTASAEIEPFLNEAARGDSLLFTQGMAGPAIEIDIPLLASDELEEFIINKMELEFFLLEDASSEIHEPVERIIVQAFNEDGDINIIEDVFLAIDVGLEGVFGGNLTPVMVNGVSINRYNAIITVHAIREMREASPITKLRIVPRNKITIPNRSIIYGPEHSQYPMKLKVNYSK